MQQVIQTQVQDSSRGTQQPLLLYGHGVFEIAISLIAVLIGMNILLNEVETSLEILIDTVQKEIVPELKDINARIVNLGKKIDHLD